MYPSGDHHSSPDLSIGDTTKIKNYASKVPIYMDPGGQQTCHVGRIDYPSYSDLPVHVLHCSTRPMRTSFQSDFSWELAMRDRYMFSYP